MQRAIHHFCLSHMDLPMNIYLKISSLTYQLHSYNYVLDNYEDQKTLKDLCCAHNEPILITIVHKFTDKMYELETYGTTELLNRDEPTMANVLINYFHVHKSRKNIL